MLFVFSLFVCSGVSCEQTYLFPCQEFEDFSSGVNDFFFKKVKID